MSDHEQRDEKARRSEMEDVYGEGTPAEVRVISHVANDADNEDTIYFAASGGMDLYSAETFKKVLHGQILANPEISNIEVDFTEVTFIDSTTIGILVSANKLLREDSCGDLREIKFVIKIDGTNLATVFKVTSLDRIFEIQRTDLQE